MTGLEMCRADRTQTANASFHILVNGTLAVVENSCCTQKRAPTKFFAAGIMCREARIDMPNVTIALVQRVTMAFCCRAGKIPDNQICYLTSLEPDKVTSSRQPFAAKACGRI